jgi:hypothetical protein
MIRPQKLPLLLLANAPKLRIFAIRIRANSLRVFLASFIPKFTLFAITAFIKQEKAIPFGVQMNQKNLQFIVH